MVIGAILSAILLTVNAFICATISHFFDLPGWLIWQFIPGSLAVTFVLATMVGFMRSNVVLRVVYSLAATWLGVLNFAFFAAIACWVIGGLVWLTNAPIPNVHIGGSFFGLGILAAAYGVLNAAWIRNTNITVRLPNLPDAWEGRTAALITDIHLGNLRGPKFVARILRKLRSSKPDAVFISGDLFDGSPFGVDRLMSTWQDFSPSLGTFFVTGNHDEFADRNLFLNVIRRAGIRVLENEMVDLDGLQLIGVHDSEAMNPKELRRILRRVHVDPQAPSILLAHQPGNLAVAEEEGISLQLSGHTHGGQFWPWNLVVSRMYGRFAYGLSRLGSMLVFTSNGVGTWGPPLKVGTKSEIVLIRFEKGETMIPAR